MPRRLPLLSRLPVLCLTLVLCLFTQRSAAWFTRLPWPEAGVVVVGEITAEALDRLGPVWYYTYGFDGPALAGHERVYLAYPDLDRKRIGEAVRSHPRSWWFVGNEPNDPHQDNLSPGAYAAAYHRFHTAASKAAPLAQIVPGGIANADWRWADSFRESYREQYGIYPPVDAWNIHNYVLELDKDQLDVEEFKRRVLAFREWMSRVGEGSKPLFLTEFGALYGSDRLGEDAPNAEEMRNYIDAVVGWLAATDHVQRWAWFATSTDGAFHGDLYDASGDPSLIGHAYREALQNHLGPGSGYE